MPINEKILVNRVLSRHTDNPVHLQGKHQTGGQHWVEMGPTQLSKGIGKGGRSQKVGHSRRKYLIKGISVSIGVLSQHVSKDDKIVDEGGQEFGGELLEKFQIKAWEGEILLAFPFLG